MMNFYFNDCIPSCSSDIVLIKALDLTFREYLTLQKQNKGFIDGVVTHNSVDQIKLDSSKSLSLENCLSKLNVDIRGLAFRLFSKYPLRNYFPEGDDLAILENENKISIDKVDFEAINPAITFMNNGCLFTLNLHKDLSSNFIEVINNKGKISSVLNLYGEKINTDFIDDIVKKNIFNSADNLKKLIFITNGILSSKASKQFNSLVPEMQEVIIKHFDDAIKMSGSRNIKQDKDLVKEVSCTKCNHSVFEIRIFSPVAFRVYFSSKNEKIFINSIERKPANKVQSSDISAAKKGLETMFAENGN